MIAYFLVFEGIVSYRDLWETVSIPEVLRLSEAFELKGKMDIIRSEVEKKKAEEEGNKR